MNYKRRGLKWTPEVREPGLLLCSVSCSLFFRVPQ